MLLLVRVQQDLIPISLVGIIMIDKCGNTVEVEWDRCSEFYCGIMCQGNKCAYDVSLTIDANYPYGKLAEQLVIEMWNRLQENIK